jgi:hypothetical protein
MPITQFNGVGVSRVDINARWIAYGLWYRQQHGQFRVKKDHKKGRATQPKLNMDRWNLKIAISNI